MTDALSYFSAKLAHETDASDVYAAQKDGDRFVLVDVRSDEAWAQGRITGAVHLRRWSDTVQLGEAVVEVGRPHPTLGPSAAVPLVERDLAEPLGANLRDRRQP